MAFNLCASKQALLCGVARVRARSAKSHAAFVALRLALPNWCTSYLNMHNAGIKLHAIVLQLIRFMLQSGIFLLLAQQGRRDCIMTVL